MRCLSCNAALTDFEATRKYASTGAFIDLCNWCFGSVADQITVLERNDLAHEEDTTDENDSHCGLDVDKDF